MEKYFRDLIRKTKFETIPGLSSEIRSFLSSNDKFSEYYFEISKENHYYITIKLHEYNSYNIKNVFYLLVKCIEYNTTFYMRNDNDHITEYLLLSKSEKSIEVTEPELFFFCKIVFSS